MIRRNLFAFVFVCVWFFSVIGSGQTTKSSKMLLPVLQDGKWGYIDRTGKISIRPQFDDAGDFSEELARVRIGEKWGYITLGKLKEVMNRKPVLIDVRQAFDRNDAEREGFYYQTL